MNAMFLRVKGGIDFDTFENKSGEDVADIFNARRVTAVVNPENEWPTGVSFEDAEYPHVARHDSVESLLVLSHLISPFSTSLASTPRTCS